MKYCVLNVRGKFCQNTFLHYTDIVIIVLGYGDSSCIYYLWYDLLL